MKAKRNMENVNIEAKVKIKKKKNTIARSQI